MLKTGVSQLNQRFRGEKLQLAREFRGLTQKQLAGSVSTSGAAVSLIEAGKRPNPSSDLVLAFSEALHFPSDFFFGEALEIFQETECHFRHRRSTSDRLKTQVRARASLIGSIVTHLRSVLPFPKLNVPSLSASNDMEVEIAAQTCRSHWGLNIEAPILQPGRAVERASIVVVSGLTEIGKIDAFSRYGENAMIFLNIRDQKPSRLHFDLAHELGHLVIHRGLVTGDPVTEEQANKFASCFLMPAKSFGRELRSISFSWDAIFSLKRRWKVSAAAIVRRGFDLGILSATQYRRAFQDMSAKGWRRFGEPFEPDFQEPELLRSALKVANSSSSISLTSFAARLGITESIIQEIIGVPCRPEAQAF